MVSVWLTVVLIVVWGANEVEISAADLGAGGED